MVLPPKRKLHPSEPEYAVAGIDRLTVNLIKGNWDRSKFDEFDSRNFGGFDFSGKRLTKYKINWAEGERHGKLVFKFIIGESDRWKLYGCHFSSSTMTNAKLEMFSNFCKNCSPVQLQEKILALCKMVGLQAIIELNYLELKTDIVYPYDEFLSRLLKGHFTGFLNRGTHYFDKNTFYLGSCEQMQLAIYDKKLQLLQEKGLSIDHHHLVRVEYKLFREYFRRLQDSYRKEDKVLNLQTLQISQLFSEMTKDKFRITDGPRVIGNAQRTPTWPIWQIIQQSTFDWN